jgi:hypothetical protein
MKRLDALGLIVLAMSIGCGGSTSADVSPAEAGTDGATGGMDSSPLSDSATQDGPIMSSGGDGGSSPEAGPGGSTSSVVCGSTTCAIPSDMCCVFQPAAPPPDFTYACGGGAACPPGVGGNGTTSLKCSSAANCPSNTVCCAHPVGNDVASSCQATCTGTDAQLCDPRAASSGCVGDAGTCSSMNIGDWNLPATFGTCGGKKN